MQHLTLIIIEFLTGLLFAGFGALLWALSGAAGVGGVIALGIWLVRRKR